MCVSDAPLPFKEAAKGIYAKRHSIKNHHIHQTKMLHVDIFRPRTLAKLLINMSCFSLFVAPLQRHISSRVLPQPMQMSLSSKQQ
ncbi:hypothetical protein VCSRO131_3477 [Vibrio cholerae]|nr:hypothetical protein VCSRO131_3477 [Vibrio cholerae]